MKDLRQRYTHIPIDEKTTEDTILAGSTSLTDEIIAKVKIIMAQAKKLENTGCRPLKRLI